MDIIKTRKILKLSKDDYADEEVQEIIDQTEMLARFFIDMHMKDQLNVEGIEGLDQNVLNQSKIIRLFTNLKTSKSKCSSKNG
ncbi:MAG: hypothetical protein ACOCXT_00225 [Candidatus Dojkabacteria bacterium]